MIKFETIEFGSGRKFLTVDAVSRTEIEQKMANLLVWLAKKGATPLKSLDPIKAVVGPAGLEPATRPL